MNYETDEQSTIYSIIEYISEHFIGLILLVFAFLIIYFVDHINNLNAVLLPPQSSFPTTPIKVKSKKIKKH
jgi:hypothetical protein